MMQLEEKPRLTIEDLEQIHLKSGAHDSRKDGVCAMEAAAWLAGREHTDHPICVSPSIGSFIRSWNDSLDSDEERDRLLKSLLPEILETASTAEIENDRGWMAIDWLARIFTPAFLDKVPKFSNHAKALRKLKSFTSKTWSKNKPVLDAARAAAGDAARAAARDAARKSLAPIVTLLQQSAQDLVRRMAKISKKMTSRG